MDAPCLENASFIQANGLEVTMATNKKKEKIAQLKKSVEAMRAQIKETESSLKPAWSMPMSEVVSLKASAEKKVKEIKKRIFMTEEQIKALEFQ